jgi:hypothetical protein
MTSNARKRSRMYRAEVSHTPVGSPILKIVPLNPKGPSAHHRQLSAFLYDLASEMELRSGEIDAQWVISPEAWNEQLTLEIVSDKDKARADEFVAQILNDRNLI